MDKLDRQIMAAKKQYSPNKNFKKATMKKIHRQTRNKKSFLNIRMLTLSGLAVVLVLILAFNFTSITNTKPSEQIATNNTNNTDNSSADTVNEQPGGQSTFQSIDSDISQLDKEVSGYSVSYSDSSLDNLNQ